MRDKSWITYTILMVTGGIGLVVTADRVLQQIGGWRFLIGFITAVAFGQLIMLHNRLVIQGYRVRVTRMLKQIDKASKPPDEGSPS